jgi:hypothetical protein
MKGRWQELEHNRKDYKGAKTFLRSLEPTIFLDLVGNMHRQLEYSPEPWYGLKVMHYMNTGCKIFDRKHHYGVFDWGKCQRGWGWRRV